MHEVKLELLVWRTRFEYQSASYELGVFHYRDKVICYPILGGQVQYNIEEWLPRTTIVKVSKL